MSKLGTHGTSSTKRIDADATSWPGNSSRLSTRVATATSSANALPCAARASPKASVSRPPTIGSQISTLSRGQCTSIRRSLFFSGAGRHLHQHRQQDDEAEDHGEGIVVEAAVLHAADDAGDAVDDERGAVDEDPVDQAGVALLPRPAAELHATGGDALDPQIVEAVLVLVDAARQREPLARLLRH